MGKTVEENPEKIPETLRRNQETLMWISGQKGVEEI